MIQNFLFAVLLLLYTIDPIRGKCMIYDTCIGSQNDSRLCSKPFSDAIPLDGTSLKLLYDTCPHMLDEPLENSFCCSPNHVHVIAKQFRKAHILFGGCPSCYSNFQKLWCEFACSPQQDSFLKVDQVEGDVATHVTLNLSETFANEIHSSCQSVRMSGGGMIAMSMMCGSYDKDKSCSVVDWFKFMGSYSALNGIPYDINIIYHPHDQGNNATTYLHKDTSKCHESPREGLPSCSVHDCSSLKKTVFALFPEDERSNEGCSVVGYACSTIAIVFATLVLLLVLVCLMIASISGLQKEEEMIEEDGKDSEASERMGKYGRFSSWVEMQLEFNCALIGNFMNSRKGLSIFCGVALFFITCFGLMFINITTDPAELWSSAGSGARMEKRLFEQYFHQMYRIAHITLIPKNTDLVEMAKGSMGPVYRKDFLDEVFMLVEDIQNMKVKYEKTKTTTLEDICLRPLGPTHGCMINSPTEYLQNNIDLLDKTVKETLPDMEESDDFDYDAEDDNTITVTYIDHYRDCVSNNFLLNTRFNESCMGESGVPIDPLAIFGGSDNNLLATAVHIYFIISGTVNVQKAEAWELGFINLLKNYNSKHAHISFMTERSISDEIARQSSSDTITILIACILMMSYMCFSLGSYTVENNSLLTLFTHSKFLQGFAGVLCVGLAVISAIGCFAIYELIVPAIALVTQFFPILAIGSNRMFMIQACHERYILTIKDDNERRFKLAGDIGSVFLVTTTIMATCLYFGSLWSVPATRCYCLMLALGLLFILVYFHMIYMTIFTLDTTREKKGVPEIFCCVQVPTASPAECDSYVKIIFDKYIAETIMRPNVKTFIISAFFGSLFLSCFGFQQIQVGIDQKMSVPQDSYVYLHFKNMEKYLNTGPPVYFVVQGDIDYSNPEIQNKFCSIPGCNNNSVGSILKEAVLFPEQTYLTGSVLNWMDSYLNWINPVSECCMVYANTTISNAFCSAFTRHGKGQQCVSCETDFVDYHPDTKSFYKYMPYYLQDVPFSDCPSAGIVYKDSVHLSPRGHVEASHFMTYHVPLKTSKDFISALEASKKVARKIERELDHKVKVFPVSVFYMFYEQYLTSQKKVAVQLIMVFGAIFSIFATLCGLDFRVGMVLALSCLSNLIYQLGTMWLFAIELNPITTVNLITSTVISVEFFAHLLITFQRSIKATRVERAKEALVFVGPPTFCGVFLTTTIGSIVLAFAHSQFFRIYFFQMYISSVVSCAYIGFFVLPVFLSFMGGEPAQWRLDEFRRRQDTKSAMSPDNDDKVANDKDTDINETSSCLAKPSLEDIPAIDQSVEKSPL